MMANRRLGAVLLLLAIVFSQFAYPRHASAAMTRYVVASGGLDTGPCDSWANACTLQRALFVAGGGDEIWVQQGTYKPTSGTDRSASFIIPDGVAVYGGFLGTETARDQRNPNPANTILSGEINDQNLLTDNSFHVVTIDNAGAATRLDGFTITRGYVADADGNPYGGGVYITNSSPVLNNLIITDNRAGNTVGSGGGGVYIDDTDGLPLIAPTISNVTFLNNYSGRGGGLFSQRSSPTLTNVVFQGNQALATGGGGANFQTLNAADPAINPILVNVSFINNTATGGGGMFLGNSTGSLTNVTFSGNVANRRGGGLLLEFSSAVLTNVTFYNNTSNNNLADPKGGGGVMVIASNPTLNNVTFGGNTSNANGASGGAMRVVKDPASPTVSNPLIRNAIFWGDNSTEITSDGTGSITLNDSIVQGGCPAGATCTNVLNSNPLLGSLAGNGGFTQTMSLGWGSPAIDAGNNSTCASTDQRGVARPQWSACDMGAFEAGAHIDNAASDFNAGSVGACVVDNLIGDGGVRLNLPGSTTCTFESRVFDAGDLVDWVEMDWTGSTPAGTSIELEVRTGNADGTWTLWQSDQSPLNNFGGQYLQYRAILTTTDSGQTPVLEDVTLRYVLKGYAVLSAPLGMQSNWDHEFRWTGRSGAANYLLEVYRSDDVTMLWKWYTAAQVGCDADTSCAIVPGETLGLGNGEYKWRVADYDPANGYGIRTNFANFTLGGACYSLTTGVNPSGGGTVTSSAQNCAGGYTAGSVAQVSVTPNAGYVFTGWSGDASGTATTVSVTMDGNKSVTANLRGNTLVSPSGTLTTWSNVFSWTGHAQATNYLLEVRKADETVVLWKWYTSAQAGCAGGSACSLSPVELTGLANGSYKWRVRDYGAYGYGVFTPFMNFTISAACYTLTTSANPSAGGVVTASAQNCGGGYTAGTVVQVTVTPNAGYVFTGWSGDASGTATTVSVTMNGNKSVTANLRGNTLLSPSGTLTSWSNTFTWTGHPAATHYLLVVQRPDNSIVLWKWYTSSQAGCAGGSACSLSPVELAGLANGSYKWRIRDYGAYGYGPFTPYMNFAIP